MKSPAQELTLVQNQVNALQLLSLVDSKVEALYKEAQTIRDRLVLRTESSNRLHLILKAFIIKRYLYELPEGTPDYPANALWTRDLDTKIINHILVNQVKPLFDLETLTEFKIWCPSINIVARRVDKLLAYFGPTMPAKPAVNSFKPVEIKQLTSQLSNFDLQVLDYKEASPIKI